VWRPPRSRSRRGRNRNRRVSWLAFPFRSRCRGSVPPPAPDFESTESVVGSRSRAGLRSETRISVPSSRNRLPGSRSLARLRSASGRCARIRMLDSTRFACPRRGSRRDGQHRSSGRAGNGSRPGSDEPLRHRVLLPCRRCFADDR